MIKENPNEVMEHYRLGSRQRRHFEEAVQNGYLFDPTPAGTSSRLHMAWEAYCQENDLPLVIARALPDAGGYYGGVLVQSSADWYDHRTWEFDERDPVDDSRGPWDEAKTEALDRFGVAPQDGNFTRTSTVIGGGTFASFYNFPLKTIRDLAVFLAEKVREYRVPCMSKHQIEGSR